MHVHVHVHLYYTELCAMLGAQPSHTVNVYGHRY